jgi:hypothetical protein
LEDVEVLQLMSSDHRCSDIVGELLMSSDLILSHEILFRQGWRIVAKI